ncbi:hypothetical protein HYU19_04525 [Candidatus Woesearchaeota archaeon]|nr:hypothetical protein [Candidatus Woesearchaeota archaeon]
MPPGMTPPAGWNPTAPFHSPSTGAVNPNDNHPGPAQPASPIQGAVPPTVVSPTAPNPVLTPRCSDSDKGRNYALKGTTTGQDLQGRSGTVMDSCVVRSNKLVEHYCVSTGKRTRIAYDCAKEGKMCRNGACVK